MSIFHYFYKKKKTTTLYFFFIFCLCTHKPVYAQNTQVAEKENSWVLAFSEFSAENIPAVYQTYSKTLPELLSYKLRNDIGKKIPLEEKKARAILKLSQKKLKAISELNALMLEKDKIFLLPETEKTKKKKLKDIKKKITQKQKEIDLLQADIKIEDLRATYADDASLKKVAQWKDGELFVRSPNKPLATDLADNKVDALITGEIKEITGYVVVTVYLQTGLANVPEIELVEAGKYEDLDKIAELLANLLYSKLQALPEREIFFEVEPKNAKVFVNENEVLDFSTPVKVYAENIEVFATAKGYKTSSKEFSFGKQKKYKLKINLQKLPETTVSLDVDDKTKVFSKTQELEGEKTETETGKSFKLEGEEGVLEFESNGVQTFVLFDPEQFETNASLIEVQKKLHKKNVKEQIEKQRSIMYWSLGAVYISLPATLILSGVRNDKMNAYNIGRLPRTPENLQQIKNLNIGTNVMIGVTTALAVNYFTQMVIYLIKADAALPQKLK